MSLPSRRATKNVAPLNNFLPNSQRLLYIPTLRTPIIDSRCFAKALFSLKYNHPKAFIFHRLSRKTSFFLGKRLSHFSLQAHCVRACIGFTRLEVYLTLGPFLLLNSYQTSYEHTGMLQQSRATGSSAVTIH